MMIPALQFRLSNFYFWYFAFVGAFAPYFALYLQSLGFSASQIGILLAVNPVTRIFGPNLWGWLSDHQGARGTLIRWTATLTAVTFVAVFLTRGFGWLFLALIVLNVFWSAVLPLAEAATLHRLEANFGAYGKIRLWGSVSFVLVVILGGYLLDFQGVSALAPLAVSMMAFMAISTFFLPPDREIVHRGEHAPIMSIALRPEVIALLASFFLMQIAHGPFNAFYSIHLAEAGYSKKAIGWLWSVGVIAEIALFFWLPSLMRRFSIGQILRMSFGCAFLRFLIVAWGAESAGLMVLAQLMHAVTFGAYHAAGVAAVHQIFRGRHQARGQALYTSLGYGLGGTLGTLMAGFVWESWGARAAFSMGAFAALLALFVTLRRPLGHSGALPM